MNKIKKHILIIDDDQLIGSSIQFLLRNKDYDVNLLNNPRHISSHMKGYKVDLVVLDMNFSINTTGKQGLEALKLILSLRKIPVILITGWATVQLAVEGMKLGAVDFFAKPWDNSLLVASIDKFVLDSNNIVTENPNYIVGEHPSILSLWKLIHKVSKTNAPILISGQSGSGKELIAEAIHQNSERNKHYLVKLNLGAIPSALFESEIFGVKKGAFTGAEMTRIGKFEKAHEGTIFLDEIGELAKENQVKLLRILQDQKFEKLGSTESQLVDTRIISATNKDLSQLVANGSFREDLFYRINVIKIHVPSLEERRSDIPLLAKHFVGRLNSIYESQKFLEKESLEWLSKQNYQGNVRQLKNQIQRAFILSDHDYLSVKDLKKTSDVALGSDSIQKLNEMEKKMIKKALNFHESNISRSANALGITRSSLYRKMKKYDILS